MLDMSSDVGLVRMGLYQALEEIELDSEGSVSTVGAAAASGSGTEDSLQEETSVKELEYSLLELLMNKRFVKALRLTRQYRHCWPQDFFGTSDDEEVAAILRVYGRYIASKKTCNPPLSHSFEMMFTFLYPFLTLVNIKKNVLRGKFHGNEGCKTVQSGH